MLKVEENGTCFQCVKVTQVVSFKDAETGQEDTLCETCLNNYVDGKIGFD
jgi:hypothetical protein